jgi:hypothetical protein
VTCQQCSQGNPYQAGTIYHAAQDFHLAAHQLITNVIEATRMPQFVDWLARRWR